MYLGKDLVGCVFGVYFNCIDVDFRIIWCFIWIIEICEVFDFVSVGLFVEFFDIVCFGDV